MPSNTITVTLDGAQFVGACERCTRTVEQLVEHGSDGQKERARVLVRAFLESNITIPAEYEQLSYTLGVPPELTSLENDLALLVRECRRPSP